MQVEVHSYLDDEEPEPGGARGSRLPPLSGETLELLERAALAAASQRGFAQGSIEIAIVDDPQIHQLNRQFLDHDWETDVISFPYLCERDRLEGELIVSWETAVRQAAATGWPAATELALYVIHGTLHLTGMDDASPAERGEMRAAEQAVFARLGAPGAERYDVDRGEGAELSADSSLGTLRVQPEPTQERPPRDIRMSTATSHTAEQTDTAKLSIGDTVLELPVITGTEKESALDISKLRSQTGVITLDEGYVNTGSTTSAITFLNGEEGILRYRGYPIESIAQNCDFLEMSYLLLYGELPTAAEIRTFREGIRQHTMIHEEMKSFYNGFPRDAHPMAILSSVVGALSTFYQDSLDPNDPEQVTISIYRLLAKLPTIAAYSYKKSIGQPFMYPRNDLDYTTNFLHLMFATPTGPYEVDPDFAEALNLLLIVHADHEQNCSTSTVRMVGSSDANLFACISAGISALWGPLHGGANEACVNMLQQIADDGGDVDKYVEMAKDKKNSFRLMGFGHRVYKNYDPRALIIKKACDKLLAKLQLDDPLFQVAQKLEKVALQDPYFVERKLYPNVDFYSGVIYRALGIPIQMFTVLFAIGRLPGWLAHWVEMHNSPSKRIGRPRQIYVGPTEREWIPIEQRS